LTRLNLPAYLRAEVNGPPPSVRVLRVVRAFRGPIFRMVAWSAARVRSHGHDSDFQGDGDA